MVIFVENRHDIQGISFFLITISISEKDVHFAWTTPSPPYQKLAFSYFAHNFSITSSIWLKFHIAPLFSTLSIVIGFSRPKGYIKARWVNFWPLFENFSENS